MEKRVPSYLQHRCCDKNNASNSNGVSFELCNFA